jgi:hypothetical protein
LTALGFLVMGYHPGAEDDGIYLASVKADLNPSLYPHDAAFFQLQMRTSVFDTWMAQFVRASHLPLPWAELLWQCLSILLILWACWRIVSSLFAEPSARWGGLAMVAAMFTLPVAGTALFILDQYLHPRGLATALLLFAVARILAGKGWQAAALGALAFALHPLMGAFGISFCCILTFTMHKPLRAQLHTLRLRLIPQGASPALALIPFAWVIDPPSPIWMEAMKTRHWLRVYQWAWYEWLGAIAPLLLFWLLARHARQRGEDKLARFATAIFIYAAFQQVLAMLLLVPPAPVALCTLEPMRYLHLVYLFLALLGGAYLGRYALKAHLGRWALFLLLANGSMAFAQRQLFPATPHLELPWQESGNPWLQAFAWIRQNTPTDAYFALDPQYMAVPGEDYHGFRALAERSALADAVKDTAVVTKIPELGPQWDRQVKAQNGWEHFERADFQRLRAEFGVDWVLVRYPQPTGLECQWHNDRLAVCNVGVRD